MNARSLLISASVFGAVLLTGCPRPVEPVVAPNPPRIDLFTVSATEAAPHQTVTLSWRVSDATSVTIEQLGSGPLAISGHEGQKEVTLGERDAVFALVATGDGGTDSRVLRVNVDAQDPVLVLAAVPSQIVAGQSSVLVYSGPEGTQLFDEAGVSLVANASPSGSLTVSPLFGTTYTLKAGEAAATASVAVGPGVVELNAAHVQGVSGRVRLTWKAGGATGLAIQSTEGGELFTSDSKQVIAEGSFEDVLPAGLPEDRELSYTLTVTDGVSVASKQVTVRVGSTPAIDSFTAPTWAAEGQQFELKWVTRGAVRAELWMGATQLFEATSLSQVSSGSFFPNTPDAPTTYELRVFDAEGRMAVAQASTQPIGAVTLVKFDASIGGAPCTTCTIAQGGEPVTLEWEVTNARRLRIVAKDRHLVHEVEGVDAERGSVVVYPNAASVEYVLTADNTAGSAVAPMSKIVTVTALSGAKTWPEAVPLPTYGTAQAQIASTPVPNVVGFAGFPTVEKNVPGEAFVDIRAFGVDAAFSANADTTYQSVSTPDPFTGVLFGKRVAPTSLNKQYVMMSINGWFTIKTLSSGSSGPDGNGYGFPSKALEELAMAPYFDDLMMTPEGKVQVASIGTGSTRRLVVQYTDVTLESAPGSRLTFQGQVYASGKVVFAYQKLDGLTDAKPLIGVQDASKTVAVMAPDLPSPGDTYTFFAPTMTPPPYPVTGNPYLARMVLADGGFMEFDARPPLLTKDLLYVSEVNPMPGSNVVGGEWVELTSVATVPINLHGFTLDFGNGQRRDITADLVVPAGGRVLLAQSADAGDGLPVDYAYGTEMEMVDSAGRVSLMTGSWVYASLEWTRAQLPGPGVSLRFEFKRTGLTYSSSSSVKGLVCGGNTSYGNHGQLGSPRMADASVCFPYVLQASGGTPFESLALAGQKLNVATPTVDEAKGQVFVAELPFPVRVGETLSSRVYVSSNGFLTLQPLYCMVSSAGCFSSNDSTPTPEADPLGTVAVFWDAMDYAKAPLGGIFWTARDPDGVPNSGDEYALISWEHVALAGVSTLTSDLSFQAKLTPRGDVELRFGNMTCSTATLARGSSATTWIEDYTGTAALKVNVNSSTTPGITANTTKLLTWTP